MDGGVCPADVIAELTRFVNIDFAGGSNVVDAAIAKATVKPDPRILRSPGNLESLRSPEVRAVSGMAV